MKILLHICCGVCAAGAVDRLTSEGHEVFGYYYNPNIHPRDEYERRLATVRKVAGEFNFPIETGSYNAEGWLDITRPLKDEPEGGRRCEVCFRFRLKESFRYLEKHEFDAFTTTLTIGPRKSAEVVNRVGQEIGGERFIARDFKKKAGFQRAVELAKKWELYRQDYCGCLYSVTQDK